MSYITLRKIAPFMKPLEIITLGKEDIMKIIIYNDDGTIHQELDDVTMFVMVADKDGDAKTGNGAFLTCSSSKFLARATQIITKIAFEKVGSARMIHELLNNMEEDLRIVREEELQTSSGKLTLAPKPNKEVN